MLHSKMDEKNKIVNFMGKEINLLKNYPKSKRNLDMRSSQKSKEDIAIARKFEKDWSNQSRKHRTDGCDYPNISEQSSYM